MRTRRGAWTADGRDHPATTAARGAADSGGGDSSALLRLWERGGFEDFGPAAPLRPVVDAARRKAEMVDRLRAALDAGDAETVARLWPALRGDPIASSLAIRASAVLARRLGAAVARAVERGDDAATVAAVREAEAAGVAVEPSARRAARAALERDKTRRELQAAVAADDRQALATLAISGRLADLGRLEPDVMRRVVRALAWPHLERALAADDDAAILAAYDADLFDGALPPPQRARVDLARVRTGWLDAARAALRRRDVAALRAVMAQTPPGAEARLSRVERNRMERLTARDAAVERLATALREGPDTAIVEALERVEAAGATLPEALDWAAVRGVVDRVTLADAIRQAATAIPPDYARLARLLPAARAASASEGDGRDVADLGRELGFDFAQLEATSFARPTSPGYGMRSPPTTIKRSPRPPNLIRMARSPSSPMPNGRGWSGPSRRGGGGPRWRGDSDGAVQFCASWWLTAAPIAVTASWGPTTDVDGA